ncbi:MAG: 3-methyl-2-oxobutanoate hydroxymethyltransferase [Flavobacteriales bacterium]
MIIVHIEAIRKRKYQGEKITVLTAYDYSMATLLDEAGIDILLVGDSAANVMAGHVTTLPITLDQMIYHASAVARAAQRALVIADLPFGSYQTSPEKAFESAVRMMKETDVHGIKLEGGARIKKIIEKITTAGVPVMGHLGLTPQSIYQFGTYTLRAQTEIEAEKLLNDAKSLVEAGCFALVLEKIPAQLAAKVTTSITIPTIGIGAGKDVDGQVLVIHDLLGMNKNFQPKFVRRYLNLHEQINQAVKQYIENVKKEDFPNEDEQYRT